eukprot:CAMPEP_0195025448 /NCGR_PEP_ID=MMETSP0326_2-20130528/47798_1 /TAXON_ID=2866 ORGANISM="Crypthecodinium cohnii, Strain Seligo" /NCGR_SAMPLE_ID=MMETSP0326_2 /ASSEMBLY_ACC=CAM_ASM_000348 /LENGTH=86 /DNA_ID=CAMNT_0040046807 /DNA_START=78 /DNA_END=336 /DNA_ORIENTATION=+
MAIAASVCSAERGKVAGLTLVSCRVDKAMMNGGGTKNSEQGARDKGQGKDMGLVGPQTSPAVALGGLTTDRPKHNDDDRLEDLTTE